jgi:hypothetical protein
MLEIIGDGTLMQRWTSAVKASPTVWIRHYYDDAWGNWICMTSPTWQPFEVTNKENCVGTWTALYNPALDLVTLRGKVLYTPAANMDTGARIDIGTIPAAYCPDSHAPMAIYRDSSVAARLQGMVGSGGTILMRNSGTFSAGTTYTLHFNVVYHKVLNQSGAIAGPVDGNEVEY